MFIKRIKNDWSFKAKYSSRADKGFKCKIFKIILQSLINVSDFQPATDNFMLINIVPIWIKT